MCKGNNTSGLAVNEGKVMKIIGVEEHYTVPEYMDYLYSRKEPPRREIIKDKRHGKLVRDWLTPDLFNTAPAEGAFLGDIGALSNVEKRLSDMDKAGIDIQVLSTGHPSMQDIDPTDAITWARKINDELAQFIKKYPKRFAGFARLPFQEPLAAVDELERAVKKLGLKGAITDSHVRGKERGEYLDDSKYWPIFEKAEELNVPIYLHPREPSPQMIKPYLDYRGLPGAMWGYAAEAGLHAMRLICSGLFDKYPRLKIILGHMGEGLPFGLWRMDKIWSMGMGPNNLRRKPGEYVKNNFVITTSGNFSQPALMCAYLALGADNILFAVDYHPGGANVDLLVEAVQFIEAAPISDSDKEKIFHLNTEKLLGL